MRLRLAAVAFVTFCGVGILYFQQEFKAIDVGRYVSNLSRSECGIVGTIAAAVNEKRQAEGYDAALATAKAIKVDGPLTLYTTVFGNWWVSDLPGAAYVLQEQKLGVYGKPKPGAIVLDCGANIGSYTRTAIDAGAALVVAIEPSPSNIEALRRNFAAEIATGRVIVYPKGVWDREERKVLTKYSISALDSFVMKRRPEGELVGEEVLLLTTIDRLVLELGLTRVDLIKLDIEGAERQALMGGAETIRRFKPELVVATENLPGDIHTLPRVVTSLDAGYIITAGDCSMMTDGVVRPDFVRATPAYVAAAN